MLGKPAGRLLVEVAVPVVALVVAEGGEEGVHRGGGRAPAVGPERDLALGPVDPLDELLEVLSPLRRGGRAAG